MSDSDWKELKKQALDRKRDVVYNTDGCDALYFPKSLKATKENFISRRLTHALGTKIDTVSYCPLSSGFGYLTSKTTVGDQLLVDPDSKSSRNVTGEFLSQGTDPLQIAQEFSRDNNLEFFISLRCNDTHDIHHSKDNPFFLFPPYKEKHPELLMGSYYHRPRYSSWSSVDFSHKEIRNRFVAIVKELLTNYDPDGIELDFCRHLQYFRSVGYGLDASDEECEMMTDCMRQIRTLAESIGRKRGKPILVAVRVPDSLGYSRACGLDVEKWMQEKLIDIYIGSFYMRLNPWQDSVDVCKKYGVKFYPSMDETRIRKFAPGFNRHSFPAVRAREAAALAAGADGLYFFNREGEGWLHEGLRGSLDDIRFDDKSYFISYRYCPPQNYLSNGEDFNNLAPLSYYTPVYIATGSKREYKLEIGDDFSDPKVIAALPTLTAYIDVKELGSKVAIRVNGNELKRAEQISASKNSTIVFEAPLEFFKMGINKVEVSAKSSKEDNDKELAIFKGDHLLQNAQTQVPWCRLYAPANKAQSETIVDGAYRISDTGTKQTQCANLIYPIYEIPSKDLKIALDVKVQKSSCPLSNVIRIADGKNLEILTLEPNKISLYYTGKSIAFNTADKFHDYQITMKDSHIIVNVDGKEIFNEKMKVKVGDPISFLKHRIFSIAYMNEKSLLIGSLSEEGTGAALWKNIRLITDASGVLLNDLRFDLTFQKLL